MARPKRYNAEYFSHDADMRNDVRIKAIRRKFKLTGYAVWCCLLEVLTDSDYFEIEWTDITVELLSADFDIEPKELTDIVDYCITLGLLQNSDNMLHCENHQKRFDALLLRRNRNNKRQSDSQNPAATEFQTDKTPQKEVLDDRSTHSKVKESKVKESKVNNNTTPPIVPPVGGDAATVDEIDDESQSSEQGDPPTPPDPPKPSPTWKESFEVYQDELRQAYRAAAADKGWINKRQKFHPNLDILLSLEKACADFWSTEEGWCHKLKEHRKKGPESWINWRNTFNTTLTLKSNQVFKSRNQQQNEKESY